MFRKNVVVKTRISYRPVFLYRLPGPGSLPRVSMSHPIMTFQTRITQCTCNPLRRRSSIVIWCRSKFQQMYAYKLVSSLYLLVMCMEKPGFSTGGPGHCINTIFLRRNVFVCLRVLKKWFLVSR